LDRSETGLGRNQLEPAGFLNIRGRENARLWTVEAIRLNFMGFLIDFEICSNRPLRNAISPMVITLACDAITAMLVILALVMGALRVGL
jgi:hypothetical protein